MYEFTHEIFGCAARKNQHETTRISTVDTRVNVNTYSSQKLVPALRGYGDIPFRNRRTKPYQLIKCDRGDRVIFKYRPVEPNYRNRMAQLSVAYQLGIQFALYGVGLLASRGFSLRVPGVPLLHYFYFGLFFLLEVGSELERLFLETECSVHE